MTILTKTDKLVCDHTSLWKLAEVLSDAYHRNQVISNQRRDLLIIINFESKSCMRF